jgi:two-component system chemotaxis response regulator CheB
MTEQDSDRQEYGAHDMTARDIILIGGSAGAVEAILRLAEGLPRSLPAAVLVVVHFPAGGTSALPHLLSRRGPLPASHAQDGERYLPGHVYVAPPDYHLSVEGDLLRLSHGPRVNRVRPAIDALFQSAAASRGPRVVGVILSGTLDDGTAGLIAVKRHGGVSIAQDPADAMFGVMPRSAIAADDVDHVLPLADIALLLAGLALGMGPPPSFEKGGEPMPNALAHDKQTSPPEAAGRARHASPQRRDVPPKDENALIHGDMDAQTLGQRQGVPSVYSCPECGGVLWQMAEERLLRFRCHTGHVYAAQSLYVDQSHAFEQALSFAIRGLAEKVTLARQLAAQAQGRGQTASARFFDEQARTARTHATVMQGVLETSHIDALPDDGLLPPSDSTNPEGQENADNRRIGRHT